MRRTRMTTLAAATLTAIPLVAASLVAPASAAPAAVAPKPMLTGLVGPLSVAVSGGGTALRQPELRRPADEEGARASRPRSLFAADKPNTEVGGVSVHNGVVTFTTTKGKVGKVMKRTKQGKIREVANTGLGSRPTTPTVATATASRD